MSINPPDVACSTNFGPSAEAVVNAATGAGVPFTLELWVRVNQFTDTSDLATITAGAADFMVGVETYNQTPYFVVAIGLSMFGPAVRFGQWTHLAVSYDGANLTFFADGGEYVSVNAAALAPASSIAVGPLFPNISFDVYDVAFWSGARTALEISADMWAEPSTSTAGLSFYGDFSVSPPVDLFGSQITTNNTTFNTDTPNVRNVGTGYLLPAAASDLTPDFSAPFSLSVWTRAIASSSPFQVIYANGWFGEPGSWSLCFVNSVLSVQVVTSSQGPQTLSLGTYILDQWTNLTVTWDGTTCSTYMDSASVTSGTFAPSPAVSPGQSILFGQMGAGLPTNHYTGHIQSLSAWNVCLTAQQIEAAMYVDPSNDPACTAFFCCTIDSPADLTSLGDTGVSGEDLLHLIGTDIAFDPTGADSLEAPAGPGPSADTIITRGRSRPEPWEPVGQAPRFTRVGCSMPLREQTIQPFSDDHVQRMKRDLYAAMAGMRDPASRKHMADAFDAEVTGLFARAQTDAGSIPKAFTYERRDDQWVILQHNEGKLTVIAEYDASNFDGCTMWWLTFLMTLLTGFLIVFNMRTPTQRIHQLIEEDILGPTAFRDALLVAMDAPVFSAGTMLSMLGVLYRFGLLGKVMWTAFSLLSWWAAGVAVFQLALLFAPPPASSARQATVIAGTVMTVAQLIVQLQGYKSACGNQEDLSPETV
jgi:hypothetical protein